MIKLLHLTTLRSRTPRIIICEALLSIFCPCYLLARAYASLPIKIGNNHYRFQTKDQDGDQNSQTDQHQKVSLEMAGEQISASSNKDNNRALFNIFKKEQLRRKVKICNIFFTLMITCIIFFYFWSQHRHKAHAHFNNSIENSNNLTRLKKYHSELEQDGFHEVLNHGHFHESEKIANDHINDDISEDANNFKSNSKNSYKHQLFHLKQLAYHYYSIIMLWILFVAIHTIIRRKLSDIFGIRYVRGENLYFACLCCCCSALQIYRQIKTVDKNDPFTMIVVVKEGSKKTPSEISESSKSNSNSSMNDSESLLSEDQNQNQENHNPINQEGYPHNMHGSLTPTGPELGSTLSILIEGSENENME